MGDYEIIQYKQGLGARILLHSVNQYKLHWHPEIEVLFVLEGSIRVNVNGVAHEVGEGGVFLLNANDVHSTAGNGRNLVAAVQISPELFGRSFPELTSMEFLWPAPLQPEALGQIQSLIAMMLEEYRRADKAFTAAIESLLHALLVALVRSVPCRTKQKAVADQRSKELSRILRITAYIGEHYAEKITLESLAQREYLSTYYLSHFIREKMGLTFQEYLKNVRLRHAVQQLATPGKSVEQVAADCGFASVKAFSKSFRELYDVTPGEYRRRFTMDITDAMELAGTAAYLEFDSLHAMRRVQEYLGGEAPHTVAPAGHSVGAALPELRIDAAGNAVGSLFKNWRWLGAVGRAYDILRADLQAQLTLAKQELGLELLRFHGIFSDEMRVCTRTAEGTLRFSWQYTDNVLDFLVGTGLAPILDFTFMPGALKSRDISVFWYKGNISPPADMAEWERLVREFAAHCVNRYGLAEVQKWVFEVWNEPDYTAFSGDVGLYIEFLAATSRALQAAGSGLRLAGPSVMQHMHLQAVWTDAFLAQLDKTSIHLDCFTYHVYGESDVSLSAEGSLIPTLGGREHVADCVNLFYEKTRGLSHPPRELFITEFNASAWHKNYLLDTMLPAVYILDNYLRCHSRLNGIAFWTLSDIFEEDPALLPPFSGGFGLMTAGGIRKPGWHALRFLRGLGDEILAQEEGLILTRRDGELQLLCWHYVEYDKLYRGGDRSLVTYRERYNVFENRPALRRTIALTGLQGAYEQRCEVLGREDGSAFDEFARLGLPQELRPQDAEYLRARCRPSLRVETVEADGGLQIEFDLPPHEIRFYSWKRL